MHGVDMLIHANAIDPNRVTFLGKVTERLASLISGHSLAFVDSAVELNDATDIIGDTSDGTELFREEPQMRLTASATPTARVIEAHVVMLSKVDMLG
jgi:pyridoxine 5'-phosphate synthase PdxJ